MKQKNYLMKLMDKIPLGYVLLVIAITIYGIAGIIELSVSNAQNDPSRCEKLEKQVSGILSAGL